jgi:hypothetical protein
MQQNTELLTCFLSYSLGQNASWEAHRFLASQEIPRSLWNPKVHYGRHKCPPPVPFPEPARSNSYPHIAFPKIHLNIILPSKPGSPKWSLSFTFPHQNHV